MNTALLIFAASAVAIADVLLKRVHGAGSVLKALSSPWMIAAIGLYIVQIIIFTHLFISGAKLSYIGALQTVLYASITVLAGILVFHETVSLTQAIGIGLAFLGALLMQL